MGGCELSKLWVRREGGKPLPGRSTLRKPEGPSDTLTACHEWRGICTNFRTNKSTCQRKETWKGRCPTAQLKCNCRWWNSVGWRITAVRKKRLHQIWRLAWLLFQPVLCLAQLLAFPPCLSAFFFTYFLSFISNPKYVRRELLKTGVGNIISPNVRREIFSKYSCLLFLTTKHTLKGTKLNHVAHSCFAFPLQSGSIFLLLWSSAGL